MLAALSTDGPSFVACIETRRDGAQGRIHGALHRAHVDGGRVVVDDALAITNPKRVVPVVPFWSKGNERWPEDGHGSPTPFEPNELVAGSIQPVRLRANAHGMAAVSGLTGVVAVFERASLDLRYAFRMPIPAGAGLGAIATREGVVVTLQDGAQTAILHLDPSGRTLAKRVLDFDVGELLLLDDTHVLLGSSTSTQLARLPKLACRSFDRLEENEELLAVASTPKASLHFFVSGSSAEPSRAWSLVRAAAEGKRIGYEAWAIPRPPAPPPTTPQASGRERVRGPAVLGVAAKPGVASWTLRCGEDAELALTVRNAGGPLRGIYVELGGPALATLAPVNVQVAGHQATFVGKTGSARAELADVAMAAAETPLSDAEKKAAKSSAPIAAPASPSEDLIVRVRGTKVGQGLLTIRVGPLSATGAAGSAMQGKTVTVSD